jgi:natural product precursor
MKTLKKLNLNSMEASFTVIERHNLRFIVGGNWDGTCVFSAMGYIGSLLTGNNPYDMHDSSMTNHDYLMNGYANAYAEATNQSKLDVITGGVPEEHIAPVLNSYYDTTPGGDPHSASTANPCFATYATGEEYDGSPEGHAVVITGYDEDNDEYQIFDPATGTTTTLPGDTEFESTTTINGLKSSSYYDGNGYDDYFG